MTFVPSTGNCFLEDGKIFHTKRYAVLISIFFKLQIFSATAVYLWVNIYRCFGVDFCLHLQRSGNLRKDEGDLFNPKKGDKEFPRNVSKYQSEGHRIPEQMNLQL